MSGFEVVGVILGVVPLFISAAEHYCEGIDKLKGLRSKDINDSIRETLSDILAEVFILSSTLQRLVDSLDLQENLKERLSEHNASPEDWENPAVAEALHDRLGGPGAVLFRDSLQRVAEAFAELVKLDETLLLSEQNDSPIQQKAHDLSVKLESLRKGNHNRSRLWKRLQRISRERAREGLKASIRKHNKNICMLLDKTPANAIEVSHRRKMPSTRLRAQARALYEVLSDYWECRCNERRHDTSATLVEAKLCLYRYDFHPPNSGDLDFDVMFSIRKDLNSVTSYIWQESTVRAKASPSPSPPFKGPESPHREKIECFDKLACSLLANRSHESCLRMFLYDDKKLWRVSPEKRKFKPGNSVSLKEELHSPRWTLVGKAGLAVTLSHAVLQLSESPWLDHKWSNAHISFLKSSENHVGFQLPYVSARFEQAASAADLEGIYCEHPNASLLNLGIMLLEIHEWKPMELKPEDYAPDGERDANTIFRAATRFFDELCGHIQPNWREAIRSCLYPREFYGDESRLQDDEIRRAIYAKVVAPLEREYQNLLASP